MDPNDSLWVDRRLESLEPSPGWEPDAAAGLARFRRLHREAAVVRKRRIWFAFAAAAACLAAVSVIPRRTAPPPRSGARSAKCWPRWIRVRRRCWSYEPAASAMKKSLRLWN